MRAESSRSCHGREGPEGALSGASSTTTWALVPPMPKELTPARRGSAPRGQSRSRSLTWKGVDAKSIFGLGVSKCRLGGICRCFRAITVLIRLAAPAAADRWPTLDFNEPRAQEPGGGPPSAPRARKARVRAVTSTGSPSAVAVPWAST